MYLFCEQNRVILSLFVSEKEQDETCLLLETKGVYPSFGYRRSGGLFGLKVYDHANEMIFTMPIKYYADGDIRKKCFLGKAKEIQFLTNFEETRDCWYIWLPYKGWAKHCNYDGWMGSLKVLENNVKKQVHCEECGGSNLNGENGIYIDRNAFNSNAFKTLVPNYTTCDTSCSFWMI